MTNFHVGQKVVCIHDFRIFGYGDEACPAKGIVYTIRDIIPPGRYGHDFLCLRLAEILNDVRKYGSPLGFTIAEPMFAARRFRPVKTTNIDVFLRMLAPTPERVDA